ncbi:MAG: EF-P lysine aminoacylase EpmA [Syntrophales bacterium]
MEQDGRLAKKRETLWKRARMIHAIRDFFTSRDYLEVETPHLIPALIPETHIDAISCGDWFLHTSPELHMKRLLAAGYPRIFQICKCFRDGERGSCHLPEFTMLEWYCRGMDYRKLMKECEELIVSVAGELGCGDVINYQGRAIGLQRPWESISVREAFACYAPISMDKAVTENCFDEIMVSSIEPRLGLTQPTFIYDYPVSGSALAKQKKDDFVLAERFELYMGGKEIANACSELTDPKEHHRRFLNVNKYRHSIGKSIYPVSERFLQDIAAMPQAAGIALGVDRLAMIFCDSSAIDCVVSFVPEFL